MAMIVLAWVMLVCFAQMGMGVKMHGAALVGVAMEVNSIAHHGENHLAA